MTEYCVGRWAPSTSLRAQRSNPCRRTKKEWIASSQELLAMTEYCVGRWAPSPSLRAQRSNPCRHKESMDCFVARAPRNDGVLAWQIGPLPAFANTSNQSMPPAKKHGLLG